LLALALNLLARREHTRAELEQKLSARGSRDEVAVVLDRLQQRNLQSDARFAEAYVSARLARFGSFKLRRDLCARGVSDELIDRALAESEEGELTRAREVWRRKFGGPPADAREFAKQARFLHSRGFGADILKKLLRDSKE
jgi:regulatory protein